MSEYNPYVHLYDDADELARLKERTLSAIRVIVTETRTGHISADDALARISEQMNKSITEEIEFRQAADRRRAERTAELLAPVSTQSGDGDDRG